jgi:hypothetical protein
MRGRGIPPYAQVRGRWACLLSAMPNQFQNCQPSWQQYPRPPSENLGLSPRRFVPRAAFHHLPGMCTWNVMGLLCSLSLLVPELGIQWLLNRKCTLGALSFHRSMAQPEPPIPSSPSEIVWVETLRGPDPSLSWKATVGDIPSAPGSSDVVVLGSEELGLLGFSRAPLLPTDWGQVAGVRSCHARRLRPCTSYYGKH